MTRSLIRRLLSPVASTLAITVIISILMPAYGDPLKVTIGYLTEALPEPEPGPSGLRRGAQSG